LNQLAERILALIEERVPIERQPDQRELVRVVLALASDAISKLTLPTTSSPSVAVIERECVVQFLREAEEFFIQ